MNVIRPSCRARFTVADMEFLIATLGDRPQALDALLDDENLFRALLEKPACLQVSTHLYFYVLVRHVLCDAGLDDRDVADYVAEVMAEFSRTERTSAGHTMVQLLALLHEQDAAARFVIQAHIGNLSLFLSGVFPSRLRQLTQRRAAPDFSYYEDMGRLSFRAAGDHPLARRYGVTSVFNRLSADFRETRLALNELAGRLVFLGPSA